MTNQYQKDQIYQDVSWEMAYVARELRHKKKVTLSCLEAEKPAVLEQLSSFSNSNPITMNTVAIPNSKEIYLEIFDIV